MVMLRLCSSLHLTFPPSGLCLIRVEHFMGLFIHTACEEALSGFLDEEYEGCQTKTREGLTCQAWSVQFPHTHSFLPPKSGNTVLTSNYCRNPKADSETIWSVIAFCSARTVCSELSVGDYRCYTTDPNKRWDYCDPLPPQPGSAL
jgi:hypothetical protein